jgi:branched-chain amino acid transport system ATP-binding protein
LMDEPAGGLTPREIDHVIEVVERVRSRGVTIVLIEHVMRFLTRLSSRVMIMHHGEKIYEGPPEGLASDAKVVDVYLGAGASSRMKAQFDAKAHP